MKKQSIKLKDLKKKVEVIKTKELKKVKGGSLIIVDIIGPL